MKLFKKSHTAQDEILCPEEGDEAGQSNTFVEINRRDFLKVVSLMSCAVIAGVSENAEAASSVLKKHINDKIKAAELSLKKRYPGYEIDSSDYRKSLLEYFNPFIDEKPLFIEMEVKGTSGQIQNQIFSKYREIYGDAIFEKYKLEFGAMTGQWQSNHLRIGPGHYGQNREKIYPAMIIKVPNVAQLTQLDGKMITMGPGYTFDICGKKLKIKAQDDTDELNRMLMGR